jgi:hypothetical protein
MLLASAAHDAGAAPQSRALEAVLNAPLSSKDAAKPIEVIAFQWWVATDGTTPAFRQNIDPARQIGAGKSVTVGSFQVDEKKGPVSLVVDVGAAPRSTSGATSAVRIGIECMNRPMACAIPAQKTVLVFRSEMMSSVPVTVGDRVLPLLVGRDAHSYRLPAGETVRVQVELGTQKDLDPLLLKAWLIYGQNAAEVVPGQTSKSTVVWWIVGIGALALVLLWRRLLRR